MGTIPDSGTNKISWGWRRVSSSAIRVCQRRAALAAEVNHGLLAATLELLGLDIDAPSAAEAVPYIHLSRGAGSAAQGARGGGKACF